MRGAKEGQSIPDHNQNGEELASSQPDGLLLMEPLNSLRAEIRIRLTAICRFLEGKRRQKRGRKRKAYATLVMNSFKEKNHSSSLSTQDTLTLSSSFIKRRKWGWGWWGESQPLFSDPSSRLERYPGCLYVCLGSRDSLLLRAPDL